jgi:hypothetical protein
VGAAAGAGAGAAAAGSAGAAAAAGCFGAGLALVFTRFLTGFFAFGGGAAAVSSAETGFGCSVGVEPVLETTPRLCVSG